MNIENKNKIIEEMLEFRKEFLQNYENCEGFNCRIPEDISQRFSGGTCERIYGEIPQQIPGWISWEIFKEILGGISKKKC